MIKTAIDTVQLRLVEADKTISAGRSLASTLYAFPTDILLRGPLGAGKTSFLQGFFAGLGVTQDVTSPTYALEQRYAADDGHSVIHLDLYRLRPDQARELLHSTDDEEAIRCIEWADRMEHASTAHPAITIDMSEPGHGRLANIAFDDIALPSDDMIDRWRADVRLPAHIAAHCDAVADVTVRFADALIDRGVIVRTKALHLAARAHDLFRFVDFRASAAPEGYEEDPEAVERWNDIRTRHPNMKHEATCAAFLRENGFDAIARIVETHGVRLPPGKNSTIEQALLFYADKRTAGDKIMTTDERFDDFNARYGDAEAREDARTWRAQAHEIERSLFPDGAPF